MISCQWKSRNAAWSRCDLPEDAEYFSL